MKSVRKFYSIQYPYKVVVIVFVLFLHGKIQAENRLHPLSVSIMKESWGFPSSPELKLSPFYPGISTGIYRLRADKKISFPQSAHLGYFYNNSTGSAIYLYADQGIHLTLKCGYFQEMSIGMGFFNAFHSGKVYKRNDAGEYAKVTDFGKPSLMFSLSETIGIDLYPTHDIPFAPFIKAQWIVSYPYFETVLPVCPTILLQIGSLVYF